MPGCPHSIERMFDRLTDAGVLDAMASASRAENAGCARRLAAIGELYARRAPEDDVDRINWAIDGHANVVAGRSGLACRCGQRDCAAAAEQREPVAQVVIQVIAEQAAVEGRSEDPGYLRVRADPGAAAARTGGHRHSQTTCSSAAASGRRAGVSADGGGGAVCPVPGSDVPVSRVRSAGADMRRRPHDRLPGRADTSVEPQAAVPLSPLPELL